jgi:hypothetical protein
MCRGYKQLVYGLHNNPAPTPYGSVCHHQMLCVHCIISAANMGGMVLRTKFFLAPFSQPLIKYLSPFSRISFP